MVILSNAEFAKLTVDQSPRLHAIASQRADNEPTGFLVAADAHEYVKVCTYSGDLKGAQWLKNLLAVAKNGKLQRIRDGSATWEDHLGEVLQLKAAKEIPFAIGDHIELKENGKYGSIVDYIPDSKQYLVVLDPFQVMLYKANELEKVAALKE
jgi:hypothetical protein